MAFGILMGKWKSKIANDGTYRRHFWNLSSCATCFDIDYVVSCFASIRLISFSLRTLSSLCVRLKWHFDTFFTLATQWNFCTLFSAVDKGIIWSFCHSHSLITDWIAWLPLQISLENLQSRGLFLWAKLGSLLCNFPTPRAINHFQFTRESS